MSHQPLPFRNTLLPLVAAPLGAMVVFVPYALAFGHRPYVPIQTLLVGAGALVAGCVFVLPVLAAIPKLRRPPLWVAALWGVLVCWVAVGLTGPVNFGFRELLRWEVALPAALQGAAAGLVYAVLARRK